MSSVIDFLTTWASELIALVSTVIAVVALYKSNNAQKEANELQRQLVEIEARREQERVARLSQANVYIAAGGDDDTQLYLHNDGEAIARNLRFQLDGEEIGPRYVRGQLPNEIRPDHPIKLHLGFGPEDGGRTLTVIWDDDSASDQKSNYQIPYQPKPVISGMSDIL